MQTPANLDVPQGVVWYPSEVQAHIPYLTLAQAQKVLAQAIVKHDAMIGLNWDVFHTVAKDMFPDTIDRFAESVEAANIVMAIKCGDLSPDDIDIDDEELDTILCYRASCARNPKGYGLLGVTEYASTVNLTFTNEEIQKAGYTDRGRIVVGDYVLILLGEMGISD